MTKKLIIIGAGMASGRALEHLFEQAPDAYDVTLFNAEPRGTYNRIMLSPVLSGDKTFDEIVTHTADHLRKQSHRHREDDISMAFSIDRSRYLMLEPFVPIRIRFP